MINPEKKHEKDINIGRDKQRETLEIRETRESPLIAKLCDEKRETQEMFQKPKYEKRETRETRERLKNEKNRFVKFYYWKAADEKSNIGPANIGMTCPRSLAVDESKSYKTTFSNMAMYEKDPNPNVRKMFITF